MAQELEDEICWARRMLQRARGDLEDAESQLARLSTEQEALELALVRAAQKVPLIDTTMQDLQQEEREAAACLAERQLRLVALLTDQLRVALRDRVPL